LRAEIDPAERLRLIAVAFATPFWCAGMVLPAAWKPVSFAIGEVVFLAGAIRYHVLQGQRGQFLARFVSPQVVHLVRQRGLAGVVPQSRVELSVLMCDLRGFTAFSETAAPEESMTLLDGYYSTVGEVVARFGGSIKDFAGDGILALVGAPITHADHCQRAVAMALEIRERTAAICSHWNDRGLRLGLGIGVASGFVTVGVIHGAQRLEYAAVGPAINLAARLCSRAEAGQILVDQRLAGSVGETAQGYHFERLETAELKGFARPVEILAVISSRGAGSRHAAVEET
jgi:class 3 adenylate cyclase